MNAVDEPLRAAGARRRSPEGLTHSTLGGFFWTFSGAGAQALLQLVVLVVLARLLPPASFGVVQAALVVVGFTSIFSHLGVGPAVVQRPDLEPRHLRTGFTLSLAFGVATAAIVWTAAPLIAWFFRIPDLTQVVRVMSLVFVIQGASVVSESLLQRELKFRWLALVEVIAFALGFGLIGVILAFVGWGVWALVAAHVAQNVIKTVVLLGVQPHPKRPQIEPRAFRQLLSFGGGFTAARIGNYIAGQGDSLVVGRWLGAGALGLYGRAYQLMTTPANLFGTGVDRVLFPAMAKVQNDPRRLVIAYRRSIAMVALVMLPTSVPLVLLAPELVRVLLGPEWSEAVLPFQIFAVGMLFRTSYKMSDSIARATGAVYRRAWRQGVFAVLVIGGAWVGQFWGIPGVAAGVLMAIALNFLLMAELSLQLAEMSWRSFWSAHLPAVALAIVLGVVVWIEVAVARRLSPDPLVVLAASAAGIVLTVVVLLKRWPQIFLGEDGQWIVSTLSAYLPVSFGPFGRLTRDA